MKIKIWNPKMTDAETKDLAYWERNVLALHFAEGWYFDWLVSDAGTVDDRKIVSQKPRYDGWSRVISLQGGTITFHIPDDFEVGNLPLIKPNWDGHTTEEKWQRIFAAKGIHS